MAPAGRTDELISAMLARRAAQPMPAGLLETVVTVVATERQARAAGARGASSRWMLSWPVLAGALVMLAIGVAGAGLATGMLALPSQGDSSPAAVAATPLIAASSPVDSHPPTAPPAASPEPSPRPTRTSVPGDRIPPDTLAEVTRQGDRLRVFTVPSNADPANRLWPLLPSGSRLLVLDGPVPADGYEWYEVLVEGQPDAMYGWVASGGDGRRWIRGVRPDCPADPGRRQLADMAPFDFLVCYGGREITFTARMNEAQDGPDIECPFLNGPPCEVEQAWLLHSTYVSFHASDGDPRVVAISVPETLRTAIEAVPVGRTLRMTVAMDAPEARDCRITDPATGKDLITPNRIVAVCRLAFALRAVEAGS